MKPLREQEVQPRARPGTGVVAKGQELPRIDGPAKVTGEARYDAEMHVPDLLHGVAVNSTIARGRIRRLHVQDALAVQGVVAVLSHENRPKIGQLDEYYKDQTAPEGSPFKPLAGDRVLYSGQPIALVVAESFEAARYAASLVRVDYDREVHQIGLLEHLHAVHDPEGEEVPEPIGDADAAFASAPVTIDAQYYNAVEHHNPLEMHASTAIPEEDGNLTIYDKTQGSQNIQKVVSQVFGLPPDRVTVKNLFVGGAFGSGLRPQYNLYLAVMAALHLMRPVRVQLTRQQQFTFGHRPETWQRLRLGADAEGRLQAIIHEARGETSRLEDFTEMVVKWAGQLYACDNIRLGYQLVALDHHTPIDMRAPGATHGSFGLEVAMDELAAKLSMCPLKLRLQNDTRKGPVDDQPYSSKELRAAYDLASERFGWRHRNHTPRSMRDGHELIGWGMATGQWEAIQKKGEARAILHADGSLEVESAASDIGTGTYAVMTQIASAALGLPMEQVTFRMGDSRLPKAPVEGGSSHVTTIGSAVEGACRAVGKRLWDWALQIPGNNLPTSFEDVEFVGGKVQRKGDPSSAMAFTDILRAAGRDQVEQSHSTQPDERQKKHICAVHSAVFCEVRVDEDFGTVRVARVVSAIAAGRIINPLTARSQVIGGIVWGIGHALHEETLADARLGRFMTNDLADYHVPVQADVHDIDVIFVEEDDRIVSPLGAKGVGEIGLVGVAAAISNAIYHATGRRIRSTPMTPEKVMAPGEGWAAGDCGLGLPRRVA